MVRIEADNASLRNENASVRNENASLRNQLASQGGLSAGDTRPAVPQSPGVFSVRTFQEQLDALDESSEEDGEENDSQTPVSNSYARCFRAPYSHSRYQNYANFKLPQVRDATEQTETKPNLLRASYPKKRKIHNTMTLLPPGMALIPQLPLTDKEIIV